MPRRLDPNSSQPLYRQLADDLRSAVRTGELQPGQLLPPEPVLAGQYDVSLDVVRDALAVLRSEGLIATRHGKGSRVRELVEVSVVQVPPGARITARMPTPEEREEHGLLEGTPILVIEQVGKTIALPADRVVVETVSTLDGES